MAANPERRVLITGGAGFVGANLAVELSSRHPEWEVLTLDNLVRRGSELNLARLRAAGVRFEHADVRLEKDLGRLEPVDAIVECSAEPSVLAGVDDPGRVVHTNLVGAWNCIQLARRDSAQLVFLSTSRVYPVPALCSLDLHNRETRFELLEEQHIAGASARGISEEFPLAGARTLYGTTKLAAELLIEEVRADAGLRTVINRCGVIAGPWQMGKVDQGVFTYWLIAHRFRRPLSYIGFGGAGHQVRDLLHVADLIDLVDDQLCSPDHWDGVTVNVGGGLEGSLSLAETTAICRQLSGEEISVSAVMENRQGDVPVYISDCTKLFSHSEWRPSRTPETTLRDTWEWICEHEDALQVVL